jgi:muconolactone D-isomerase
LEVASRALSLTGSLGPMDFLVEIEIDLPPALDADSRRELQAAEFERGSVLARDGVIRAIWRVPGRLANRGIWTTEDATTLHEALSSLPMWPYMDVVVTPLAVHPLDVACGGLSPQGQRGERIESDQLDAPIEPSARGRRGAVSGDDMIGATAS